MAKVIKTDYGTAKQILKFPDHYVSLAVMVSDEGVSTVDGKKIVPAGTILGGGVLDDKSVLAVKATSTDEEGSNAEGVLFNDVDVTHGPAGGALIIHGFINKDKIPTEPTAEEVAALNQITFLR